MLNQADCTSDGISLGFFPLKINPFNSQYLIYSVFVFVWKSSYSISISSLHCKLIVNEMLCIQDLKPTLNVQSDSLRAKVFM